MDLLTLLLLLWLKTGLLVFLAWLVWINTRTLYLGGFIVVPFGDLLRVLWWPGLLREMVEGENEDRDDDFQ
jgi:hypothetical protein